ncbi:class I SAM-dependent methyltransferase [Candidatus Parcubacteria bacterium]|nr:class I SAM-dependent methyltransferase [Candidatus Parcubacteria bacterium]
MEGFLNPEQILNQLEIESDITAADFGCGSGGWILPLAKKVEDGEVFAVDILEEPLSALKAKADSQSLSNIRTILCDVEKNVKIQDESCDLVLMTNLLFEIQDKKAVIEEGKRVLKSGGKILIVDWKKQNSVVPAENTVSAEEIKKIAEQTGLKLEKELDAGIYHYALVFTK